MRFLIDAELPRSTEGLGERYGHEAIDACDVGLRAVRDQLIADYARRRNASLLTGDFGSTDVRHYPPGSYPGIAVLNLPRDASTELTLKLLERFLQ